MKRGWQPTVLKPVLFRLDGTEFITTNIHTTKAQKSAVQLIPRIATRLLRTEQLGSELCAETQEKQDLHKLY